MRSIHPIAALLGLTAASSAQCPLWTPDLAGGLAPNGVIHDVITFDEDGAGPLPLSLYVGGEFTQIGGVATGCVARWDGVSWSPVGPVLAGSHVSDLELWDKDGSGPLTPELWASGQFPNYYHGGTLLHFVSGVGWTNVSGFIYADPDAALSVYDEDGTGPEQPRLQMTGEKLVNLDGSGVVHHWGRFLIGSAPGRALAACPYDPDGTGPMLPLLIVAGDFTAHDGFGPAAGLFQWDGGHGNSGQFAGGLAGAFAKGQSLLARIDPVSGQPELIVAGMFTGAGSLAAPGIAAYRNGAWNTLGSGFNPSNNLGVHALRLFDVDAAGPAPLDLYAAGIFTTAGGTSAAGIARFDGTSWFGVGGGVSGTAGMSGTIEALAVFDPDAGGPLPRALYAAGPYLTAGGLPATGLAHFVEHACPAVVCAGDGSLPAPCPCSNFGSSGQGCGNSAQAQGARLAASGPTHPGVIHLELSFAPPATSCVFVQCAAQTPGGFVLGDGLSCFAGPLLRLGVLQASAAGGATYPGAGTTLGQRSAALGDPLQAGDVRYYQVVYRDSAPGFCMPSGLLNLSNGLRIDW